MLMQRAKVMRFRAELVCLFPKGYSCSWTTKKNQLILMSKYYIGMDDIYHKSISYSFATKATKTTKRRGRPKKTETKLSSQLMNDLSPDSNLDFMVSNESMVESDEINDSLNSTSQREAVLNDWEDSSQPIDIPTSKLLKTVKDYQLENPQYIALVRVGDFYELYYDQAVKVGSILSMNVVTKSVKNHSFAFTGFPARYLDRYLETLIKKEDLSVAILEQYQDPITKLFYRKVDRIYTKGTLISESFCEDDRANYCLALTETPEGLIGLAWTDLATGEFYTSTCTRERITMELARINPNEIVTYDNLPEWLITQAKPYKLSYEPISTFVSHANMDSLTFDSARIGLMNYISKTQGYQPMDLNFNMKRSEPKDIMQIDRTVQQSLDLLQKNKSSLLYHLNQTVTKQGARLMGQRLASPSTDLHTIQKRYDQVEGFVSNPTLALRVRAILKSCKDGQRALQKILLNKATPIDLFAILSCLKGALEIQKCFDEAKTPQSVRESLDTALKLDYQLIESIERALKTDESGDLIHGVMVKEDFNGKLRALHSEKIELGQHKDKLELRLRKILNSKTLKLTTSPSLGHIIEITSRDSKKFQLYKSQLHNPPILAQGLKGKERYYIKDWTELAEQIAKVGIEIELEEQRVLSQIYAEVTNLKIPLTELHDALSELDVNTTIAQLSIEHHLVRPKLSLKPILSLEQSRHLPVEISLHNKAKSFIPNDLRLDQNTNMWVITGPNMGGKSTFLRQVALIAIMAQAGFYVPCHSAEIGIVDAVFCRVGSGDNLTAEQSTFMVEMMEASNIMKLATDRSLVIVDEIGRGTSSLEGESMAFAILTHLQARIRCRTLFATHFMGLARQLDASIMSGVANYHTQIQEMDEQNRFAFLHKLKPGAATKSGALQVGWLAGLPQVVLNDAERYLINLEEGSPAPNLTPTKCIKVDKHQFIEKLKNGRNERIINEITNIDLNHITPIEALIKLQELKKQALMDPSK